MRMEEVRARSSMVVVMAINCSDGDGWVAELSRAARVRDLCGQSGVT